MAAAALCRQTLEVGAVCPNWARTDLCGGRLATAVPTAIAGKHRTIHALERPASEKRQGTKSRGVGAPTVPRTLWGFRRGFWLAEVGAVRSARSLELEGPRFGRVERC